MKNSELIARLAQLPPDATVVVLDDEQGAWYPVEDVEYKDGEVRIYDY